MRTDVDVERDGDLHEQVKEYTRENGICHPRAYRELIERGLPLMPTKTVEATLVPPTAHEERKLQEIHGLYHRGPHEAFAAGADTQSAVNDIVTSYDLPYQVKDAVKNYVPSLDDAQELSDDHPTRMVNRTARFDDSYCWL